MPQGSPSNRKSGSFKNLKIGVLYGGQSSERAISLRSGRAVHLALKNLGFQTQWIDPRSASKAAKQLQSIDLAFIVLHGRGGEDGTLQALLEKKKLPYVGSNAFSSREAFDKLRSKRVFAKRSIPTPPYTVINAKNWRRLLQTFPVPFFVKPPCEGSSIGAFAVEDLAQNAEKIEKHLRQFKCLLVERKIVGREFTVGILGTRALPVVEMRPKGDFYDYKSKYTKGMTAYTVPAKIPASLAMKMQKLGLRVHRALGLRDFSRVDMMTDEIGKVYVLEANSIPGFTEFSLLPKAAQAAGMSFEALCEELVLRAAKRLEK